jgi:hypothetical protein
VLDVWALLLLVEGLELRLVGLLGLQQWELQWKLELRYEQMMVRQMKGRMNEQMMVRQMLVWMMVPRLGVE